MEKNALLILSMMVAVCLAGSAVGTHLEVTPAEDFEPSGQAGGPFAPASKDYQLRNTGPNSIWWGVYKSVDWLDVQPDWGPLGPGMSTTVTVSMTTAADSLPEGVHVDTLTFLDITNEEEQARGVTLSIVPPGVLEVTPTEDFEPSGAPGGPFTPPSKQYELTNSGEAAINWTVTKTVDWLDLDSESGVLDPCETTIVTVGLNAAAAGLEEGVYTDTLTFTDTTNDQEVTRGVTLSIATIWISPSNFDLDIVEGCTSTETLTIGNAGIVDLDYVIRTRVVAGSGDGAGAAGGVISSVLEGHDFTVAGDVPYEPGELIVRFAAKANGSPLGIAEKDEIL
ncbi:MAG: BACON domain-containing protein, partial [Planctomycetota bacterium]